MHARESEAKNEERPSSFDKSENKLRANRGLDGWVLRSSKLKNEGPSIFNLRSSTSKIEQPHSIFDLRLRRMGRRSGGRRGGSVRLLRRWEVFSGWVGFSIFRIRRKKNPHLLPSRLEERRTPHLPPPRPEERVAPWYFFFEPLLFEQWPPTSLSYPKIWIFGPFFQFEDRSKDRDRPSTPPRFAHTVRTAASKIEDESIVRRHNNKFYLTESINTTSDGWILL